jgi:putative ABC transport system substrate-binding protein
MIRRRAFIAGLGAAAWPLTARAQQRAMPVIGVVHTGLGNRANNSWQKFREGLRETGFVEGQNVAVEYRFGDGTQAQALAGELIRRQVGVIITSPNPVAAAAAKAATTTIPIVFVSAPDPVRTGLVSSLNRPGGNLTGVTGLTADLAPKRLGLLRAAVPQMTVVAVFLGRPPNQVDPDFQLRSAQAAGRSAGLQVIGVQAGEESEFEAAFASAAREGAQALLVSTNIYFINHREPLIALAAKYKLPAIYQDRGYTTAGGLMSYGAINTDAYRQAGVYAGRILKGEKPGDLPVVLPTKFEMVVNLKTAKALGLTIPETLLATADEVIQ